MKRFKQFLAEVVGQRDVQDIVFMHMDKYDKDDTSALRKILLPMSKKMSERIFGVRNRLTAAHITSEGKVDELVRMQGTQKSLACMTNPSDPKIWREGVATGGGIVFIVEGYPTLISNMDVYSRVDDQGRRYVPLASLSPKSSGWDISYESGYEEMLEKLKDSIFNSILRARDAIKHEIAFTNVSTVLTVSDIAKIIITIYNNSDLSFNNIEKKAKSGFTLLSTEIAIIPVIPIKKTIGIIIKKDSLRLFFNTS